MVKDLSYPTLKPRVPESVVLEIRKWPTLSIPTGMSNLRSRTSKGSTHNVRRSLRCHDPNVTRTDKDVKEIRNEINLEKPPE